MGISIIMVSIKGILDKHSNRKVNLLTGRGFRLRGGRLRLRGGRLRQRSAISCAAGSVI
jgi:hypothetical protein